MILTRTLLFLFSFLCIPFYAMPLMAETTIKQEIKPFDDYIDSVVKVYAVYQHSSSASPWYIDSSAVSGSGVIIGGNRILTNAHVIADSSFLEVKLSGRPQRYEAKVEMVSHEVDLAILSVNDQAFFKGSRPLDFGTLPKIQQSVTVYGFPSGGNALSVTKGIVSRIEYIEYSHSALQFLGIQIDAAVNPGNSGGPAISDGKIMGIVMQKSTTSENTGYVIPTPIIKHFIDDIADGDYDGFPQFALSVQHMVNPILRKKYQLTDKETGILVYKVCTNSTPDNVFQIGDIITAVDGHKIENDATIEFRPKRYINYYYYIDQHQVGDTLSLDLIRKGKPVKIHVTLDKIEQSYYEYDKKPRYYIYGGFVFTPYREMSSMIACKDSDEIKRDKRKDRKEYVYISKVLAVDINKGFHHLNSDIEKVNGKTFNTFDEFYALMSSEKEPFLVLEDEDGMNIVIEREVAEKKQAKILGRYNIESDRSKDLKILKEKPKTETSQPAMIKANDKSNLVVKSTL